MINKRNFLFTSIIILLSSMISCAGLSKNYAIQINEITQGYELQVPVCKLIMIIPKDEFVQRNIRLGGSTDNPRYFYFENVTNKLIISGWFEPEQKFLGITEYWENTSKAWSRAGLPSPQDVSFTKIGNWDAIFYDYQTPNYTNSHISAQWLQAGTWIDVHISITTISPSAEARSKLVDILKTIQVKEKQ